MIRPREHLKDMYREGQPYYSRFELDRLGYNEYVPYAEENLYKKLLKKINNEILSAYPSVNGAYKAISKMTSQDVDKIMLTTGVDGAIMNVFMTFCDSGDEVVLVTPNYGMYYVYSDLMETKSKEVKYNASFELDYEELLDSVGEKTKIIALASPSGFSGQVIPENILINLIEKANKFGCVVLLDEVYADFYDGGVSKYFNYTDVYDNLVIARSFSKSYGLAGVRVGYLVAKKETCNEIKRVRQNVEINSVAVEAIKVWCNEREILKKCLEEINNSRSKVTQQLESMGYEVRESVTNFIFVKVGREKIQVISNKMKQEKIEIKVMGENSLFPDYIRVTIGKYEYMNHFIEVMREVKCK